MTSRFRFAAAAVALLGTTSACSSTPRPATEANTSAANVDVLTASEIQDRSLGDRSVFDIVRLVRSEYLNFHGTGSGPVQVAIGSQPLTGVARLTSIFGRDVAEVRYLSAASAAQRFGTSASNGPVILVRQK